MKARIYGPVVGFGSYARVADGMRKGLEALGMFGGLVPLDAYDDEAVYPGADADMGIFVGPPAGCAAMESLGMHRERLLLLPPNSTHVPPDLLRYVEEHVTALIAPSAWAKGILEGLSTLPVQLWRHGVDERFRPGVASLADVRTEIDAGDMHVLHLASTAAQRKGTRELISGWHLAREHGWIPGKAQLRIVLDGPTDVFKEEIDRCDGTVDLLVRLNYGVERMARFYQEHHLVACPSRGEGFGLCVLESLCCNVPVVATTCTGHAETTTGDIKRMQRIVSDTPVWYSTTSPGVAPIATGVMVPIDDGPGALAPMLSAVDIAEALRHAAKSLYVLHEHASLYGGVRRRIWSWPSVTKEWADTYWKDRS